MFGFIKTFYNNMCEEGVRFPFAFDPVSKTPSITLLFTYITFLIMITSLISLQFYKQVLEGTLVSIFVWVLAVVFYRLRELDKVNLNLKTGGISLEDDDLPKEKEVK